MNVSGLDDAELDRLLVGTAPLTKDGGEGMSRLLAEVAAFSAKPPAAQVETAHLRAMARLARGMDDLPPARGSAGGGARWALAEVAAFSAKPPAAQVETAHLRAMAEVARGVGGLPEPGQFPVVVAAKRPARGSALTHRRLALGLAVPALAAPLCVATLAAAGVSLPGPVRAPFDSMGITLPNQGRSGHTSAVVKSAPLRGPSCIFDRGVAAALGIGPGPLHGHVCGPAAGRGAGGPEQATAARRTVGAAHETRRHRIGSRRIVLAGLGQPPAADATAGRLLADSSAGQAPRIATPGRPAPPSGGHPSPPSAGGHPSPPAGGGHPSPPHGHPGPPSGGGHPSPPPGGGGHPSPPPVATAIRPGKGCGDKNHVHERVDECK